MEVTSFLDIFATFVARGGPTLEEEIQLRERNNPFFQFLHQPWNDPMVVYYRWRLYSILQGDRNLLHWREEPFQIEQGEDSVVWVPPPCEPFGPRSLIHLRRSIATTPPGFLDRGSYVSATWISRMVVNDGQFFAVLPPDQRSSFIELLDAPIAAAQKNFAGDGDAVPSEPYKCFVDMEETLLSRDYIAERMSFVVEHKVCAVHCISLLLDAVVISAEDAAAALSSPTSDAHLKAVFAAVAVLSHLFIVNDLVKNGNAAGVTDQDGSPDGGRPADGGAHPIKKPNRSILRGVELVMPTLIETVLHFALCCLNFSGPSAVVARPAEASIAKVPPSSSGVISHSDAARGVLSSTSHKGTVGSLGILGNPGSTAETAPSLFNLHAGPSPLAGRSDSADIGMIGLMLCSWLRALCVFWSQGVSISPRVWQKISEAYAFLLMRNIEDVA